MLLVSLFIEQSTVPCLTLIKFRGQRDEKWGSFRSRDHFGVNLGIITAAVQNSSEVQLQTSVINI